jgi:DNA-binding NarL/FixJ family response regulator
MFSVLVIEQNEFFRKSFTEALRSQLPALTIEATGCSDEAIKKINSKVPDIIFMDIRLPGKNGLELAREIKARHPETKIGIFANLDLPEYRTTVSRCGADYFLNKSSLSSAEIVSLIEDLLCCEPAEG